ncbi:MAG: PAS domain-containing protein [bacterium]|nr:PAS domain-containing protein [bacterium]
MLTINPFRTSKGWIFYTQHNRLMLDVIFVISKASAHPDIGRLGAAYVNFLQGKELAGIERAVMSKTFAAGRFELGELRRFSSLAAAQDTYFTMFKNLASAEHVKLYEQKMTAAVVDEVQQIREIAFARGFVTAKNSLLSDLLRLFGYGGAIHNFKNFMLRNTPNYKKEFEKNHETIDSILDQIYALPETTDKEKKYLTIVRDTVTQYRMAAATASKMFSSGKTITEANSVVTIDDSAALEAAKKLVKPLETGTFGVDAGHWFSSMTRKINLMKEVEDRLSEDLSQRALALKASSRNALVVLSLLVVLMVIGVLKAMMLITQNITHSVSQKINRVIREIQSGKLEARGSAEQFEGGWRELVVGINNLIETLVGYIDNIPVPSMIVDKDFTIRHISKAGTEIGGVERDQIIGQRCYDYFKTSHCGTANCPCIRTIRSGHDEKGKTDAHPADKDLYIFYIGTPMKNQEGEMSGAMVVVVDQTAIRQVINNAGETAAVLLGSVQDLTISSQEISSTSNQQAAAVKEMVSTMEDSDQLAKSIASKINEVAKITNTTQSMVIDGFSIIKNSLAKMDEIKVSNAETILEIKALGDKIDSIWEIVNMISGIADQTKIIAFNAELEASSAGDAGKNFQIVASEIRRLADGTVTSTNEIKTKINEIQHSSDTLIMASEEGTVKITEGWELSDNLQKVFEKISGSSNISASAADQIALSINQQVSAFEQILVTLKQTSEGIDNFVVSTKATTDASEMLKEMADRLHVAIDEYAS